MDWDEKQCEVEEAMGHRQGNVDVIQKEGDLDGASGITMDIESKGGIWEFITIKKRLQFIHKPIHMDYYKQQIQHTLAQKMT